VRDKKQYFVGIYLLIAANAIAAATHYVSLYGTNNSPYLNWADAATNIQLAVDVATEGDMVLVSNGMYDVRYAITVTNSLTIQSLNGRDITILKGNRPTSTNRCFDVWSTASTNVIDGFTITNFNANNVNGAGAAIYGTIRNCVISGNRSAGGLGGTGFGGGVKLYTGSVCSNCIVRGNSSAGGGGGIWIEDAANIKIANCVIATNTADSYGGGFGAYRPQNIIVSNCYIINNTASEGGGIYVYLLGHIYVDLCIVTGNVALGNQVNFNGYGGGILVDRIQQWYGLYANNCRISGNAANNMGGGLYGNRLFLKNCLVANNQALTNFGGLLVSTGIVESCTIVSNYAGVAGGGLCINGPAVGTNSIVYFNTSPSAANFTNISGNTGLSYCCVTPAVDGTGNITNDPVLISPAGGDYRLHMNSPCVNAGTNQAWMTNAVDLEGNVRVQNNIVDMGAYERLVWQGTIYRIP